jgi:hypothetical protein
MLTEAKLGEEVEEARGGRRSRIFKVKIKVSEDDELAIASNEAL